MNHLHLMNALKLLNLRLPARCAASWKQLNNTNVTAVSLHQIPSSLRRLHSQTPFWKHWPLRETARCFSVIRALRQRAQQMEIRRACWLQSSGANMRGMKTPADLHLTEHHTAKQRVWSCTGKWRDWQYRDCGNRKTHSKRPRLWWLSRTLILACFHRYKSIQVKEVDHVTATKGFSCHLR